MTSPPLSVTRPRSVTGLTESFKKRTLPSPNRTLQPPGWNEAISSLLPALLPWATNGPVVIQACELVVRAILVVGRAGDAVALVGLGPPPVTTIERLAARRAGVKGVDRRQVRGRGGVVDAVGRVTGITS